MKKSSISSSTPRTHTARDTAAIGERTPRAPISPRCENSRFKPRFFAILIFLFRLQLINVGSRRGCQESAGGGCTLTLARLRCFAFSLCFDGQVPSCRDCRCTAYEICAIPCVSNPSRSPCTAPCKTPRTAAVVASRFVCAAHLVRRGHLSLCLVAAQA